MSRVVVSQPTASTVTQYAVELQQVFKVFGRDPAVRGVNLTVRPGEFFSILGPSGCGKTTTLRLIAGFETPTAGSVLIQGKEMHRVPPYRRSVNTVFQSYALFNHMSTWDNVAFGLKIQGVPEAERRQRVNQVLELVKMEALAQRFPQQLSGGQQQRVALARALVNRPAVVLLDEPLGALDLKLRKQMQVELAALHRQLGTTFVMVTHDQAEALALSDRIAVMQDGQIAQVGTPREIYEFPQTAFVADFIGDTNLFQGVVEQTHDTMVRVQTDRGLTVHVQLEEGAQPLHRADRVVVSVRPEKMHVGPSPPTDGSNCYRGHVAHVMYLGTHGFAVLRLADGEDVTVLQPNHTGSAVAPGALAYVHWRPQDCWILPA